MLRAGKIPFPLTDKNRGAILNKISASAQDVLDSLPSTPTAKDRAAIIKFINTLSSDLGNGGWDKIDSFAQFRLASVPNALWDLKRGVSMVDGNSNLVHTPGVGFKNNGNSWIETKYNPDVDGVNYSLNDAFWGFYQNKASTVSHLNGMQNTSIVVRSYLRLSGGTSRYVINANSEGPSTVNAMGMDEVLIIAARSALNRTDYYVNGISEHSTTIGSTIIANLELYLGGYNLNGLPSQFGDSLISSFVAGGAAGFNQLEFNNALEQFNADLQ